MNQIEWPGDWSILLHGLAEESLTAEQEQQLAVLLRDDARFRQEYVCFCQLLTHLAWTSIRQQVPAPTIGRPDHPESVVDPPDGFASQKNVRRGRNWRWLALVPCALAAILWLARPGSRQTVDQSVGQLVAVAGSVELTAPDELPVRLHQAELVRKSRALHPGDRLRTSTGGSATLTLTDRTRFDLRSDTQIVLPSDRHPGVRLLTGGLEAHVSRQPAGNPLVIDTPKSQIEILGTRLEVMSTESTTEVGVIEGRVRVTRLSDQDSVEVAADQIVSTEENSPLTVQRWPQASSDWSENFEAGVPPGWQGSLVREGLPAGSRGAVGTSSLVRTGFEIGTPFVEDGLFAWRDDSVLHATFKIVPPAWCQIVLSARTCDATPRSLEYRVVAPELWQSLPGEWRTLHLPLSMFRRTDAGPDAPTLGRIPVRLTFTGNGGPGGLVIDRIWIDRLGGRVDAVSESAQ